MAYLDTIIRKGTEYEIRDTDSQTKITQITDDMIAVSDTQPSGNSNKVWIKETADEVDVPTMAEHNALAADVSQNTEDISDLDTRLDGYENIFTGNVDTSVQNWLGAHPEATTTVQDGSITTAKFASGVIDPTLSISGAAAEAKATGDAVGELRSAINKNEEAIGYETIELQKNKSITTNTSNPILPANIVSENGFACCCVSCQPGDKFTVTGSGGNSTRLWAFSNSSGERLSQSGASETANGLLLYAPDNAAYFACNVKTNFAHEVRHGQKTIEYINEELTYINDALELVRTANYETYDFYQGIRSVSRPQVITTNANRCVSQIFHLYPGDIISVSNIKSGNKAVIAGGSYDSGWLRSDYSYSCQAEGIYFVAEATEAGNTPISPNDITTVINITPNGELIIPSLKNASENGILNFDSSKFLLGGIRGTGDLYPAYRYRVASYPGFYKFDYPITIYADSGWRFVAVYYANETDASIINDSGWKTEYTVKADTFFRLIISKDPEDSSETADIPVWVSHIHGNTKPSEQIVDLVKDGIPKYINNARHVGSNANAPLTIMHFSDIHADKTALDRIMYDASKYNAIIADKICTGDMVNNLAEEIDTWWPSDVLTCIGNHDSALRVDDEYNWTALSMANRDAYYIAPFESGWGIVHTSGTSYYYKDYSSNNVRMIVMDGMLYINNGAEATAQTAWLENLLADAITNSLHVIIAIHAPHGGSLPVSCSFSQYGQITMPTRSDANTPQAVIDAVNNAISNGLHFVCYICGHMHQDNVWNADGQGKQLMFAITCAMTTQTSDQYRGQYADAYNLMTIDTTNTLVKVIRCGGANVDDKMRTRQAICFNYSTGEKVGEVL